ncbi:MAG: homoserine kinase [Chloroflexi bacterium]|nr:MAG: homoserine kinase [Chloroflexota bacterium]
MAQHTKLLKSEIEEIANRFNLKVINHVPIEQGFANTNFLINTDHGKYILTVFEIEPIRVDHMSRVLLWLEKYEFPAPRIENLANGELLTTYQEKTVMIKPYITGQVIMDLDEEKVFQVGTALAKLHEIPVPDYLPDKHMYVENTYPTILEQRIDQKYKNWIRQRYHFLQQNIPTTLPIGLVHGDIFCDNLLFENDNFKAILDFEAVSRIYKVFDLGMTAVGICTDDTKVRLEKVSALVAGYQDIRMLKENEKRSLQMFIEYGAILTSTWRFWKYNIDKPDTEMANRYMQMVKIAKDIITVPNTLFINTVFRY